MCSEDKTSSLPGVDLDFLKNLIRNLVEELANTGTYDVPAAARYLGCSVDVVYDAVHEGKLGHSRLGQGRAIRFTREDLNGYLAACHVNSRYEIERAAAAAELSRRKVHPLRKKGVNYV